MEMSRTVPRNFDIPKVNAKDVKAATGDPFKSSPSELPADHPLAQAYAQSLESGTAQEVSTSDPKKVAYVLRRHAAQRDNGLRVKETENSIIFQVTPSRRKVNRGKGEIEERAEAVAE